MSASLLLRYGRHDSGAAAAEFALVLPAFILMILAGLQFGWAQHASGGVTFALEKASRTLLLDPSLDQAAVESLVLGALPADTAANVEVSLVREPSGGGQIARVTGVYVQQIGLPGLAALPFRYSRTVVTPLPTSP